MSQHKLNKILERINDLQTQLEQEIDRLFTDKQEQFNYSLKKGKVIFEEGIRELHDKYRTEVWEYLRTARPGHLLIAPIIYSVVIPLLLLDISITCYQQICFRVYGIQRVRRADYIVIDRQHLIYLNVIEKINCMYCGYGNGLIEYSREIIARTEQYWCPIKHARRSLSLHHRAVKFADYGHAADYKKKLEKLRKELGEE